MSHQNQFISPQPQPPPPTTTTTTLTTTIPRASPAREDCWSEDATATLIDAWGRRYVEVNRGHLRQKQWQEVADTVNARHGHVLKARRTDVQCKNRIDTIKKKYKVEKARVVDTNGSYVSPWRFFENLDHLICGALTSPLLPTPLAIKSTPILPQKRPAPSMSQSQSQSPVVVGTAEGEQYFRRNYAAVAAAAAREEEENEEESEDEEEEDEVEAEDNGDGIRKLAKVIEEFGEMYARVEREKQRQLIELEKQRMEFAKEMECQRMQMLVEMQVQLEKIKRVKRSNSDNMYS